MHYRLPFRLSPDNRALRESKSDGLWPPLLRSLRGQAEFGVTTYSCVAGFSYMRENQLGSAVTLAHMNNAVPMTQLNASKMIPTGT